MLLLNATYFKSFKFKARITGITRPHADGNIKNVEIAVPLKYLENTGNALN